jgi:hypothetical protein
MVLSLNLTNIPFLPRTRKIIGYWIFWVSIVIGILIKGISVVWNLTWPYDQDLLRDISFVQAMLDKDFFKDPSYLGAYNWYCPLKAFFEYILVKITGFSPNIIVTRWSAYFNILSPILLLVFLCKTVRNNLIISFTLIAYLMWNLKGLPEWGAASYSPFGFAVNFGQVFFLSVSIFYLHVLKIRKDRLFFYLGCLVGLAFLAHVGPAIIFLLFIPIREFLERKGEVQREFFTKMILFGIGFIFISSPLLWQIYKNGMQQINPYPATFLLSPINPVNWRYFLYSTLNFYTLTSFLGLTIVIKKSIIFWLWNESYNKNFISHNRNPFK